MPTRLSLILDLSILLASLPSASQRNNGFATRGGFHGGGPSTGHFSRGTNLGFRNTTHAFARPYGFRSFRSASPGRFFQEPEFHSRAVNPGSYSVPRPPDLRFSQRTA